MLKIFSDADTMAVYTRLTDEEFGALMSIYRLGVLIEAKEIAEGVENSNYLLITERDGVRARSILTIFEKRVEEAYLPFYLGITRHLAEAGLPTPRPLLTEQGELFAAVAGKKAAVVTFLEGKSTRQIDVAHLRSLGAMQARMHLATEGFALDRPNDLSLSGWRTLIDRIGARAEKIAPGLSQELQTEYAFLSAHWPSDLPAGVIHADLFPDNVFFIGDQVSGVIDFYFSCNDLFMYDVVITLNAWCFERDGSFNLTKARAFLHAYHHVRPLRQEEREALPILARGAALRFLLTRGYDWLHPEPGALVTPKDPMEYVRKLRFHQHVNEACEYGL